MICAPRPSSQSRTEGVCIASSAASRSLLTIGSGAPFGRKIALHVLGYQVIGAMLSCGRQIGQSWRTFAVEDCQSLASEIQASRGRRVHQSGSPVRSAHVPLRSHSLPVWCLYVFRLCDNNCLRSLRCRVNAGSHGGAPGHRRANGRPHDDADVALENRLPCR
jgi:hypothetical protein